MPESQAKKVFRIQLSVSVVLLLFTLSALSLLASFYLGMIAGKSMQRPPENSTDEAESLAEKPMSDEDLKFFSLGERKKGQDLLDLEEIRDLKKKTEELTKVPENPKATMPAKLKLRNPLHIRFRFLLLVIIKMQKYWSKNSRRADLKKHLSLSILQAAKRFIGSVWVS